MPDVTESESPPTYEPSPFAPFNPIEGYEPEKMQAVGGDWEVSRIIPVSANFGPIQLPYKARTLIVDNPTGQWWFVPQAQQYVPPYQFNLTLRLRPSNEAEVRAQTPPAFTSAPLATEQASFRWLDVDLEPSPLPFGGSGLPIPAYESGRWYGPMGNITTAAYGTNNTMLASPFYVGKTGGQRFDRIAAEVTIIGDVGSRINLGIYANNPGGLKPTSLILDAGAIAGDAVAVGVITINQFLPRGIYWLAALVTAAPVTRPTIRVLSGSAASTQVLGAGSGNGSVNNQKIGANTGITAMPATYTLSTPSSSIEPWVELRAA